MLWLIGLIVVLAALHFALSLYIIRRFLNLFIRRPAMSTTNQTTIVNVPLSVAIRRSAGDPIESLDLRKPNSGELRGLKLMDLLQMDVTSLGVLLPRIAMPTITRADVEAMEPCDLTELGVAVIGFFDKPTKPAAAQG